MSRWDGLAAYCEYPPSPLFIAFPASIHSSCSALLNAFGGTCACDRRGDNPYPPFAGKLPMFDRRVTDILNRPGTGTSTLSARLWTQNPRFRRTILTILCASSAPEIRCFSRGSTDAMTHGEQPYSRN